MPLRLYRLLPVLLALATPAGAAERSYSFGVVPLRSAVLTAEYWNPILEHVSRKAGVALELSVTRSAPESNAAIAEGKFDFVHGNSVLRPSNSAAGYQVILRPRGGEVTGQIVTLEDATVTALAELEGKTVGFSSWTSFAGYAVPMDHLLRERIAVTPVFGGNQEGIMGQLKSGKVIAAGVHSGVMREYAAREGLRYRVLWESPPYYDQPVSVHPRVEKQVSGAVRQAFADMSTDPVGKAVLEASAKVIQEQPPYGFLPAKPEDYQSYVEFYRRALVKEMQ